MSHAPPALAASRIPVGDDAAALALAAQAWPEMERAGQLAALTELVQAGKRDQLVLNAAYRDGCLCGAMLGQLLAGHAAVVWPPQIRGDLPAEIDSALCDEIDRQFRQEAVCLAQAILETATNGAAQSLHAAGFVHAGDLLYMAAEAESFPSELPRLEFRLESAQTVGDERLERVLVATYRGSLDCPLVDGLRMATDVLAGYRATGTHRPQWWLVARHGGCDVGCLLLTDHPGQEQAEMVYLGIVPEYRGRGWGLALTRHAQWLAQDAGRKRVVLAVDEANRPAIAAYETAGFVAWDRRSVLIRDFRSALKSAASST